MITHNTKRTAKQRTQPLTNSELQLGPCKQCCGTLLPHRHITKHVCTCVCTRVKAHRCNKLLSLSLSLSLNLSL